MSHVMNMYVKNISGYSIKSVNAVHTWDGNTNILTENNILDNGLSTPQSITSGYTQYDWYTVSVTFGDPNNTQKQMDFYCNSSYSQNTVVLEITMSSSQLQVLCRRTTSPGRTGDLRHWMP